MGDRQLPMNRVRRLLVSLDMTTGARKEHINNISIMAKSCRLGISNHASLKKKQDCESNI